MKKKVDWLARLPRLLAAEGWSGAEMAARVGVSPRTVEGWQQKRHMPDRRARRVLAALWRALREREREQAAANARAEGEEAR